MKPSFKQSGNGSGNTVRKVPWAALWVCMLLLVMASGCTTTGGLRSRVSFSVVSDTEESVFIKRRDLADRRRYVEHPLLEQWQHHLNGREESSFKGWTFEGSIMRIADLQTLPPGTPGFPGFPGYADSQLQYSPLGEIANSYLTPWNPDPLSMFSLNTDPGSLAFTSVIPLEYPLNDLAENDFALEDGNREMTGAMTTSLGGFFQLVNWPGQNYMEYFFPVFGYSLLICVLLTPALCSVGARYIANPIRGSPYPTEAAKVAITDHSQETMPTVAEWLGDVLV